MNRLVLVIPIIALLGSCAAPPRVPVEERDVISVKKETEPLGGQLVRYAQPGDTLHGIAFALGLDVNRLAAWNKKKELQKLHVGEKLRLTAPIDFVYRPPSDKGESKPRNVSEKSSAAISPQSQLARDSSSNQNDKQTRLQASPLRADSVWKWPVRGQIIGRFNPAEGKQGIDILSTLGQAIVVSRPGQVVYSGNSLKGYGNLIIIKHTESFLSAYAHTERVQVVEGQSLKQGEIIAAIGLNGSGRPAVQFQIRKNGVPVDPLDYLPR